MAAACVVCQSMPSKTTSTMYFLPAADGRLLQAIDIGLVAVVGRRIVRVGGGEAVQGLDPAGVPIDTVGPGVRFQRHAERVDRDQPVGVRFPVGVFPGIQAPVAPGRVVVPHRPDLQVAQMIGPRGRAEQAGR